MVILLSGYFFIFILFIYFFKLKRNSAPHFSFPRLHFSPSYLSSKAKRANSKLRDPVVLEENALRLVGHSDRDGGEVLRLAAHGHGRRVAHAQVRARRCRTWLAEDQPHHQPEGEAAWRRAGRERGERELSAVLKPATPASSAVPEWVNVRACFVLHVKTVCSFCYHCVHALAFSAGVAGMSRGTPHGLRFLQ